MARIAVDIDGVIASKLENGNYPEDYVKKEPIPLARAGLASLTDAGHEVILFTARYEEDREVTEEWLEANGFYGYYSELIMGKPQYDVLIDDRALRFDNWMDTMKRVADLQANGEWY